MITISVIIPIYNKESRIKYSIESVLSQTYENFELILINDGSTDQSGEIAKEYSFKDERIIYLNQINQGVSKARNNGIEIAKGKYITFLDADDEWDREFLNDMISSINGSNVCYCGHYFIQNNDKIKPKIKFLEGDIIESYLYNRCTPNTNSWLINKEYLNEHNIRFCEDLKLGEDMIFFSKVLMHEKNVRCINKYLSQYHKSEKNCLTEDNINKIYEDLIWLERLEDYIEKNEVDEHRKKKCIKAIKSYRIPGAIIYRFNSNVKKVEIDEIKDKINDLKLYLKEMKISNGIRSIKMYMLYYKVKVSIYF